LLERGLRAEHVEDLVHVDLEELEFKRELEVGGVREFENIFKGP